MTNNGFP